MRIVADENLAGVRELFGGVGTLVTLPGRSIGAGDVADADILLVRSVTTVNAALLHESRVRFVGSATIGTDHLDTDWMDSRGIAWAAAPGCNASSVVNYVIAALFRLWDEGRLDWNECIFGVVGLGNVGGLLAHTLQGMGLRVLGCDPFTRCPGVEQVDIDELIVRAGVLSLHTPLTRSGPHPTHHLFSLSRLQQLAGKILINSGRGAVVDNRALQALISTGEIDPGGIVLDVWENEPDINRELLAKVRLGTPHIAGYSQEGKWKGSLMVRDALLRFLGCAAEPVPPAVGTLRECLSLDPASGWAGLAMLVDSVYSVQRDHDDLCRELLLNGKPASAFDDLRKHYRPRREFSSFDVSLVSGPDVRLRACLQALGFHVAV
ncbi:MAG TPA: 4-phosphoerythronate dehydrogenase [Fluviicoccus sp.]|nr:4-phosphoerythronate dehydrogenase [Fluviicoccus sp.]